MPFATRIPPPAMPVRRALILVDYFDPPTLDFQALTLR